ncbi:MAG: DUF6531 domain-containing protein [Polyangiaceae bacterium]
MSSNVGKKNVAHKGSGHGVVGPPAMSLVTPPAPPAPTPFVYSARSANASKTKKKYLIAGSELLVKGSTMSLDPPANQPAQSGGGDVVTHATKNVAVMTMGSASLVVAGKDVCATGDIAALNVISDASSVAQVQMPLLEAGDFEAARAAAAAAAAELAKKWRAFPPSKANQCTAGHPVDLGTGYVVDDAVDLALPGFIPLVWSRSYSSSRRDHQGALGKGGWTHSFEQSIEQTETGFRLCDEEGLPVDFAPIGEAGFSFHRGQRLELRFDGRAYAVRSLKSRLTRVFSRLPSGRFALHSIRDARGHVVELSYSGDVLTRLTDSVGRELRLTSDANGRISRVEVWASAPGAGEPPTLQTSFAYTYHPEGELAAHVDARSHAETWQYDGLHRMVKVTLRNGVSFHYQYHPELGYCVRTWGDGGLHDVRIEIDFEAGETRTHSTQRARKYHWKNGIVWREETYGGDWAVERNYDEDELLVERKNGAGDTTVYEYDARGNLITATDPAGNSSTIEYRDDLPVRYEDAAGLVTLYHRDADGALRGIEFPTGATFQFEVDGAGRCRAVYAKDGIRRRLSYDAHGNLESDTSARDATTRYRHDALGRPVEEIDPIGRKTVVAYDELGSPVLVERPDGTRLSASYDRMGRLATATDALGNVTRLERVGTGRLAKLTQANGQAYRFLYDSDERLVQIQNPRQERYEFEYDRADQIVAERTFDGRLLSYRYDLAGHLARVDYPEGEWRELRHDKLGNVVEDRGQDVQITFARDALGRIEKAVSQDVTGKVTTQFERDSLGRIVADIQNGRAVRYVFDERGRRAARVLPDGERTEYHYDDLDDAFAGVTHAGKRVVMERDALGRERSRVTDGWRLDTEYDAMDRLLSQRLSAPEPGAGAVRVLAGRRYGYDSKGRVTSIDSVHDGLTTYAYDRVDQLVEAARGSAREIFEYDPIGSLTNILNELDGARDHTAWTFASGNRLRASGKARFVNDERGRRIKRIETSQGAEQTTLYGWDSKDRLREVVLPSGARVRFRYDAFGRRVQKDVLGPPADGQPSRRTVQFLWDVDVLCEEVDSARPPGSNKRLHVHEPGSFAPLLQMEDGQVFGVVNDHLGTPKELVDERGRVAWRASHSAWGDVVDSTKDAGAPTVASPFRLLGQYHDEETGLAYTRFRYFEAATGRWLSPDPLGLLGGANLLGFDGAPSRVTDPLGLAVSTCEVALDANAVTGMFERGEKAQVEAAMAGRKPVLTQDVVDEYLMGPPNARSPADRAAREAQLNAWLAQHGGRIAPAADAASGQAIQTQVRGSGTVKQPRNISDPDSRVLAGAVRENVALLSRDKQVKHAGNQVINHPVEPY